MVQKMAASGALMDPAIYSPLEKNGYVDCYAMTTLHVWTQQMAVQAAGMESVFQTNLQRNVDFNVIQTLVVSVQMIIVYSATLVSVHHSLDLIHVVSHAKIMLVAQYQPMDVQVA